jgi:hypothetical protein
MLQVSHANVSKLGLNFSMLQTFSFDAADVESRCYKHLLLDVANIKFNVVDVEQTCDIEICVEEGRRAPDIGCCTQLATWSQHGGGGRRPADVWMLHETCSQHGP